MEMRPHQLQLKRQHMLSWGDKTWDERPTELPSYFHSRGKEKDRTSCLLLICVRTRLQYKHAMCYHLNTHFGLEDGNEDMNESTEGVLAISENTHSSGSLFGFSELTLGPARAFPISFELFSLTSNKWDCDCIAKRNPTDRSIGMRGLSTR